MYKRQTLYDGIHDIDYQLKQIKNLVCMQKSEHGNGLHIAFLPTCCADLGCVGIMFDVINKGSYVVWNHFIYSDGNSDELEEVKEGISFNFRIGDY